MVVIAITCWGGPSKWWQVMNSISILFQLHPIPTSMYLLHNDIVCPTALFHALALYQWRRGREEKQTVRVHV